MKLQIDAVSTNETQKTSAASGLYPSKVMARIKAMVARMESDAMVPDTNAANASNPKRIGPGGAARSASAFSVGALYGFSSMPENTTVGNGGFIAFGPAYHRRIRPPLK
ncbi:MAG TPA: hypothetical protein VHC22_13110 [Pirellulales bacterium]|nr:hypothetical protein [Pirellulales bacterium]